MSKNVPEKFRVLLLEDNPGDAFLMSESLNHERKCRFYISDVAATLEAGLARMESGHFDLILLDLSLPDCTTIEAFDRLRAAFPDLPIIVLSGGDEETRALEAVHHGAQEYLVKGNLDGPALHRAMRYAV